MNSESGSNNYLLKVLTHLLFTIITSFLGIVIGKEFIPLNYAWIFGIVVLVVLLVIMVKRFLDKSNKNVSEYGIYIPFWVVYGISLFLGISLYPLIDYYISSSGAETVLIAFLLTILIFISLTIYAYNSKKDFSFLGGFLFVALIGLVFTSIIGFFVKNELLELTLAYVGVLIFSGYIIYDISRMKFVKFTEKDIPGAVLNLYLNLINLFVKLLKIIDNLRK